MKKDYELILLAAGKGARMGGGKNKVLLPLLGKPMILYSLTTFFNDPYCKHIILTINESEAKLLEEVIAAEFSCCSTPVTFVSGGSERQYSSYNGLQALENTETDYVMIHDAARPMIKQAQIDQLNERMQKTGAAILAVSPKDTIKRCRKGEGCQTIPRQEIWRAQTPQAFHSDLIIEAHEKARLTGFFGTDDAAVVEQLSSSNIVIVEGVESNLKMTTAEDLFMAEALLSKRQEGTKKHNDSK